MLIKSLKSQKNIIRLNIFAFSVKGSENIRKKNIRN